MTMQRARPRPPDSVFAANRRRHRRRRRRQWAMGFMSVLTLFVLLLIAGFVKEISKTPAVARPAALTATAHTTRHGAASPSARPSPSPSPSPSPLAPQVTDASSGLAYQRLAAPWRRGCPDVLNTFMFNWTAGENAVAGQADIGGSRIDWHGIACSGQLSQQFVYSGPADLQPVAVGVADAVEAAFYSGLQDSSTLEGSSPILVSGHQAWVVTFLISYPDAASEGLAWTSEAGAVVIVDRGPGQAPAMFYASVPSDLGTGTVGTLVASLQLTPSG